MVHLPLFYAGEHQNRLEKSRRRFQNFHVLLTMPLLIAQGFITLPGTVAVVVLGVIASQLGSQSGWNFHKVRYSLCFSSLCPCPAMMLELINMNFFIPVHRF